MRKIGVWRSPKFTILIFWICVHVYSSRANDTNYFIDDIKAKLSKYEKVSTMEPMDFKYEVRYILWYCERDEIWPEIGSLRARSNSAGKWSS